MIRRLLPLLIVAIAAAACAGPAGTAAPAAVTPPTAAGQTGAAPGGDAPLAAVTVAPVEATASPTLSAFMPELTQLTEPGCCMGAEWTADGRAVRFIDRPESGQSATFYAVDASTGGAPERLVEWPGIFSPDDRYLALLDPDGMTTIVERQTDARWPIRNGGRWVSFSPDSRRLAWSAMMSSGAFSTRQFEVSVADLSGENARVVATLTGGGLAGWLDEDRLLLYGRMEGMDERTLMSLSLADGTIVELARGDRIRGVAAAPGGEWVAYTVTFDQDSPEENGLWIARTDGSGQRHHLDVVGGAQWRDAERLLIVPLELDAPGHRLLQADAATGEVVELIDPDVFSFRIFAGEWKVAPTGDRVAFVSAGDQALYAFSLPPLEDPSE